MFCSTFEFSACDFEGGLRNASRRRRGGGGGGRDAVVARGHGLLLFDVAVDHVFGLSGRLLRSCLLESEEMRSRALYENSK